MHGFQLPPFPFRYPTGTRNDTKHSVDEYVVDYIIKNRYAMRTCCMPSETYDVRYSAYKYITFSTAGVKLKILIQQV
jgi:hypothetical protein